MFRRHPLLSFTLLALLCGGAYLAFFLYTFDLNRYRQELEASLSQTLARPVQLGRSSYSLRHGLALDFEGVTIGDDEAAGILQVPHLYLRLELRPLLHGQLTCTRVFLDHPLLRLTLASTGAAQGDWQQALGRAQEQFPSTLIRTLTIRDGELRLSDRRSPTAPVNLTLQALDLLLQDLRRDGPIAVRGSGRLIQGQRGADFTAQGSFDAHGDLLDWRAGRLDLTGSVEGWQPGPLLHSYGVEPAGLDIQGLASVKFEAAGSPTAGLQFDVSLAGQQLTLGLPQIYSQPLPVRQLKLAGRWTAAAPQRLDNLSLWWDGLSLTGSLTLPELGLSTAGQGRFSLAEAPLVSVARLWPDRRLPAAADWIRSALKGGSIRLKDLRLSWVPPRDDRPGDITVTQAALAISNAHLELPQVGPVRYLNLSANWRGQSLALSAGQALVLNSLIHFHGELHQPEEGPLNLALRLRGRLSAEEASTLLAAPLCRQLTLTGWIPLTLALDGSPQHLTGDLQANLQDLAIDAGGESIKPAGMPGDLFLAAELTPERLELSHARLSTPLAELQASAQMQRSESRPFRLSLDLSRLDLAQLELANPLFKRLRPRGTLALHYLIAGADGAIRSQDGELTFADLGLHFGGIVADLKQGNGHLSLQDGQADLDRFSVRLGNSLVVGSGKLERQPEPRLALQIHSESIRADEVIFHSDRIFLQNVSGGLAFSADGIRFDAIEVTLSGGTKAVVGGTLSDFAQPRVDLQIKADHADIAEVIALWQRPAEAAPTPAPSPPPHPAKVSLRIEASARSGLLYGMPFEQAEGVVSFAADTLIIHPLQFRTGPGFTIGQVVVEDLGSATPLLRISGHVAQADAAAVYTQLLQRQGLISGALRGDFFLAGRLGGPFLATSLGGISLQVEHGVLRRFPVLSKIFSLLNVSQIFTLRLPDMARDGMPFKRLSGTFSLLEGQLRTEDLVIDSNAMNLAAVGGIDLTTDRLDLILAVKPLRTVDRIVTSIPVAGWILGGKEKALITAQFKIQGDGEHPEVTAIPITSLSDMVVGIFKRVLGLPGKVIGDLGEMVSGKE